MRAPAAAAVFLAASSLAPEASAQRARRGRPAAAQPADPGWRRMASLRVVGSVVDARGALGNSTGWGVDVHAGLRLYDPSRRGAWWVFGGDVGVSIGPRGGDSPTLWLGGPSLGYGGLWLMASWSPRFVFGNLASGTGLGLRNTVSLCVFVGLACVDLAHQFLSSDVGTTHDVRLGLGFDVGMLAQLLIQFAEARPG